MAKQTSGKWCPDCGFKIGGKNHEQGAHHKSGSMPGNKGKCKIDQRH